MLTSTWGYAVKKKRKRDVGGEGSGTYSYGRGQISPKVLLNGVKPEKEILFGDIPNLDVEKAIETARDRANWKLLRPSRRYSPLYGDNAA